jgi:hypothetical protein
VIIVYPGIYNNSYWTVVARNNSNNNSTTTTNNNNNLWVLQDRLCAQVFRVLGYRSGGPGSIPDTTRKQK